MTVSIWQADGTQPLLETDIAIIGAGLVGCTAAVYLRQAGRTTTLIEARDVGLGASSRNAGFMLTGLDMYYHMAEARYGAAATREIWTLSQKTLAFWKDTARAAGVWMRECGSILLGESPQEDSALQHAARRMEANGFPCEYLPGDVLGRGYQGMIRQPGDGGLHPYDLTRALFERSGASLLDNSEVYHMEATPSGGVRVHSRKAIVEASAALICTNAYAPLLDAYFVGRVIPTRAQVLATAPLPAPILESVGYSDYGYMYYRDLPDGGFLLGGARKGFKAQEDDTSEDRLNPNVQAALDAYLRQHFPDVAASAPIARRWSGIMGFTPDGLPLTGRLPDLPNVAFAVGLNGHGLSLGAALAEKAVAVLLESPDAAGLFDARRLDAVNPSPAAH